MKNEARAAEAARDALALAIAVSEADRVAAGALLAFYPGEAGLRVLLDGFVYVLRSVALSRVIEAGGCFSEEAIAAELRSMLQTSFADRG